ncbi:MAG: Na+/H+ antiporter subunit C, partial [Geminicoccaceae bacterium]
RPTPLTPPRPPWTSSCRSRRQGGPEMELLLATGVGVLTAVGIYLALRAQTFPLVLGLTFVSYAVNLFLFAMGRLEVGLPPIISKSAEAYTDPLPQALVLTAIVIGFGMTALLVVLALRGYLETGRDHVDGLAGRPEAGP